MMNRSNFFREDLLHRTWLPFFTQRIINTLGQIEDQIGNDYTPTGNNVLRFAQNDVDSLKVVILGQDPYPQKGAATGRAFEVAGLTSWRTKIRQSSLRNIVKLLYKTYNGQLLPFERIRNLIDDKSFNILPPSRIFTHWEEQGVLLFNTYLTCKIGTPKSHREIWGDFSHEVLCFLNSHNENLYWFLWGREAQSMVRDINIIRKISCDHPMLCSTRKQNSFINSNCFAETKEIIDWIGYTQR